MNIKVEYSGSDNNVELFVVRVIDETRNIIVPLERLKRKIWNGNNYVDVWSCNNYRLCASKKYTIEQVIEALYGDNWEVLENDDKWYYDD
jgi:hypothetical protein